MMASMMQCIMNTRKRRNSSLVSSQDLVGGTICSGDQLLARPVLIAAIRQIPPDHQRHLLLPQLLQRDGQGIRFALHIYQNRRIQATLLVSPKTEDVVKPGGSYLICSALVPNTLARSYLVIYGVVVLFSLGTFLFLIPFTVFRFGSL